MTVKFGTGTFGAGTFGGGATPLYSTAKTELGKRAVHLCEMHYARCSRDYGVAPCTAAIGVTGSSKCYRSYASCQDRDNYESEDAAIRFATGPFPGMQPADASPVFPTLVSIDLAATRLRPGQHLGDRGVLQLSIQDCPWTDLGLDPYPTARSFDPDDNDRGTLWQRFLARFPYYEKQVIVLFSGFLDDNGCYDSDRMVARTYLIESIDGPDSAGAVNIIAKDPLKLADAKQALIPSPSLGKLSIALPAKAYLTTAYGSNKDLTYTSKVAGDPGGLISITCIDPGAPNQLLSVTSDGQRVIVFLATDGAGALSTTAKQIADSISKLVDIELVNGSDGSGKVPAMVETFLGGAFSFGITGDFQPYIDAYAAGQKWLCIGGEVFEQLAAPVQAWGDAAFTVSRGSAPPVYSAEDLSIEDHAVGATVQICHWYSDRVDAIVQHLLETVSGVDSIYLDLTGWDYECDIWATDWTFSSLICQPTGAKELLNEICAHSVLIWWDDLNAVIKLAILKQAPNNETDTINDSEHIERGSVSLGRVTDNRISQVWFSYNLRNPVAKLDEPGNLTITDVDVAGDEEVLYSASATRLIRSRWLHSANSAVVATISGRLLNYYKNTKSILVLTVDVKDEESVRVGQDVDVLTRYFRDIDGAKWLYRFLVVESKRLFTNGGSRVTVRAESHQDPTAQRTCFWAPDDNPEDPGNPMPVYSSATVTLQWTYGWYADPTGQPPYVWA